MKRLIYVALAALAMAAVPAIAAEKSDYQTGKLIDLRRESTGAGVLRAQGSFCLAVTVGETAYLVRHAAYWRGSYEPTDFVVGDPIDVKVKGNNLFLRKASGGELKTSITRRERLGKEPPTCGIVVMSD